MFKRRKPDEEPAVADNMLRPNQPGTGGAGGPSQPADTGLGVPPFRPSPTVGQSGGQPMNKESQMGRPPFASPNGPAAGNPPMPTGTQPRPLGTPGGAGGPTSPTAMPRPTGSVRDNAAPERRTLVVGRGISVQGMVQDAERLVVEGQVEATMIHAAELSVSPGGLFKGEIEVEDAEVAGTVDGTITARGNLIVRATGVVLGTARCRRLQVEDGGQITGRIEMINEPRAARVAEPVRAVVHAEG